MHTPEKNADSGPACEGVRRARAHIITLQLGLTAVALRAQHGTAHQTQRGSTRLIAAWFGTSVCRENDMLNSAIRQNDLNLWEWKDSREAGGLVDESAVVFWQLYQMIRLSGKPKARNSMKINEVWNRCVSCIEHFRVKSPRQTWWESCCCEDPAAHLDESTTCTSTDFHQTINHSRNKLAINARQVHTALRGCYVWDREIVTPAAEVPAAPGCCSRAEAGWRADTGIHTEPPIHPYLQLKTEQSRAVI